MINIDSSNTPAHVPEISPEFLRQLPAQALLVPRLLDTLDGKCSLYLASNGRGDDYILLRIHAPSVDGGHGGEFFHYTGKLDAVQLQFLDRLVAEHNAERMLSGPEQLKDARPLIKDILGMWKNARCIANYAAARAGYSFRGYVLHKQKKSPEAVLPAPPDLGLQTAKYDSDEFPSEVFHHALQICQREVESDPLCALDRALNIIATLCTWLDVMLSVPLQHSSLECATAQLQCGRSRAFSKRERRAMALFRKARAINEAINASRNRIWAEQDCRKMGT